MADRKEDDELPAAGPKSDQAGRRSLLTSGLMTVGLVGGYGACAAMGARYLFPSRPTQRKWLFVARESELSPGDSVSYRTPDGHRVAIARQGNTGAVDDFVALSSTCPHLGCQVHWEQQNERFFCPCHNGAFDPSGAPIAGPPKEAGQALPRFALKIEAGLLYIEVPVGGLTEGVAMKRDTGAAPSGPGHDPCLFPDDRLGGGGKPA